MPDAPDEPALRPGRPGLGRPLPAAGRPDGPVGRARRPDWAAVAATFPPGWAPDAVVVRPGYASVPGWVYRARTPVVALAHDPNLLFHQYRSQLPLFDLALTDGPAAARFARAGLTNVRAANLYGLEADWLAETDAPDGGRDIDVLFVGNLSPAVQGERLAWLGRVGRLAGRYSVVIRSGVFGADYRALVRRAKVVFNRSIRGECNLRALEAAAGRAVLFQEAENEEVPLYLEPDAEYVRYTAADLEEKLAHYLAREADRRAVAARARDRVKAYGWLALVRAGLAARLGEWDRVVERARRRAADPPAVPLSVRVWQRAARSVGPDADPGLDADLRAAGDAHALGLFAPTPAEAAEHLARAAAGGNRASGVGLAAALAGAGRPDEAVAALRRVLAAVDADSVLTDRERGTCPYPARFDPLRVGWDRAGWDHPDDPAAEGEAKLALLRWRANSLLAELTGGLVAFRAAADARPDLAAARAALGCALARAGLLAEAVDHLRFAAERDPFDTQAARALAGALTQLGRGEEAEAVRRDRRDRRLLARAVGAADPPAPAGPPAAAGGRVVTLSAAEFARRFGAPDTAAALSGFTPRPTPARSSPWSPTSGPGGSWRSGPRPGT